MKYQPIKTKGAEEVINENLRRVYEQTLDEELPDRLTRVLKMLRQQEQQKKDAS